MHTCPVRAQLLQELEPYMQQALDAVDVLREEDRRRQAALEDMIFGYRRAPDTCMTVLGASHLL